MFKELQHILRGVSSRKGLSALIVVTMALGIGTNVGAFIYASLFFFPTIDAPNRDELVWVQQRTPEDPWGGFSLPDFRDIEDVRSSDSPFSQLTAFRLFGAALDDGESTIHVFGHAVTGDYFPVFAAKPQLGRLLTADDDAHGATPAAVLSHLAWQRNFGGDPEIVGRDIEIEGRPYTIVGVTERSFQGQGLWTHVYVPMRTAEPILPGADDREVMTLSLLGRISSGTSRAETAQWLQAMGARLEEQYPKEVRRNWGLIEVTAAEVLEDPLSRGAKLIFVAVLLLLALACANVANLMLARTSARQREIAVHAALGAGRRRIAGRLFGEAFLLSSAGAALGWFVALVLQRGLESYLRRTAPIDLGEWGLGTTIDWDPVLVLPFFAGITLLTAVAFGLAPAMIATRISLSSALKEGGDRGTSRARLRAVLLVGQVCLSVALLVGAGLLGRTLNNVRTTDLGFEPNGLLLSTVHVSAEGTGAAAGDAVTEELVRWSTLIERVRQLPGVESATAVWRIPLSWATNATYEVVGQPNDAVKKPQIRYNAVATDWLETLRIPLLQGRAFEERDRADAPRVAILNARAKTRLFPNEEAIGKRLKLDLWGGAQTEVEIVGVAADSRFLRPHEPIESLVYLPHTQDPHKRMTLVARAPDSLNESLRALLRDEFPSLAVVTVVPFSEQVRRSTSDQELNADFANFLGVLGLALACLGVFSVMSYSVAERSQEMAIRQALGADRRGIVRQVLRESARLLGVGLVLGLLLALAGGQLLRGLLIGVEPTDALTLAGVMVTLAVCGLLATLHPALRATKCDPTSVLRG